MTFRCVLLGLALAAFICGVAFFNDYVLRGTYLTGNYMPISVFGGVLLVVLTINPLVRLMHGKWALGGGELAVIMALGMVACSIPGRGLMHYFTNVLMLPVARGQSDLSWKRTRLLDLVPKQMLAQANAHDVEAFTVQPVDEAGKSVDTPVRIPWHVWKRPLMFWLPLLLSLWLATIALSVVLHGQWAMRERLRYPIAQFADTLLPRADGASSGILRNTGFWISCVGIVLIHLNNYAFKYYPLSMIQIPMGIDLGPVGELIGWHAEGNMAWLMSQPFFPTAVGFAYFLSADLSLSLGLAPYVWALTNTVAFDRGVVLNKGFFAGSLRGAIHCGAYTGLFLSLVYTGRRYLAAVFGRALLPFLPLGRGQPSWSAWAARAFLVFIVCFVLQLTVAGVYWPIAILYAVGALVLYTVISRIVAETGVFFIHSYYFPCEVLLGFLGLTVMDLHSLAILFLVSTLLFIDPREAVMPFMVTGLKLAQLKGVPQGRVGIFGGVALVLAMAVALPVTLGLQYQHGAKTVSDGWTWACVPTFALDGLSRIKSKVDADPALVGGPAPGLERFLNLRPDYPTVIALGAGLAVVLVLTVLRLKLTWWPIHPVLFCMLGTWQSTTLSSSFLLGWLIKVIVTKAGGSKTYQSGRPFMVGLIAGDLLGAILPMIHGAIYYYVTGTSPQPFRIMPS
ncbi:MAG: hypothetical protein LLG01_07140 [Planctomycetaceae bacterium]|nr:hypothetical protein [Planctomycetaceae bacterium]